MRRPFILSIFLFAACGGKDEEPLVGADPAKVFERRTQTVFYTDVPYAAETPTLFRTPEVLGDLDVRAIARSGSNLYVGTASGLYRLSDDGARFQAIDLLEPLEIVDLAPMENERVAVLAPGRLLIANPAGREGNYVVETSTVTGEVVRALARDGNQTWIATSAGLIDNSLAHVAAADGLEVRDLAARDGKVYLATRTGLKVYDGVTVENVAGTADDDVRSVFIDAAGVVYAGSFSGYASIPGRVVTAGIGGLAIGEVNAIASNTSAVITGHSIGASVVDGDKKDHYHTLRWIPDEAVTAVWIDADGTRWIGTPAGISRINFTMTTLAEKVELNERYLEERHWRMDGFVDDNVRFDDAWTSTPQVIHSDHDNDGLWTEMQIGAWCLAYAETKDERYYQKARKAMDVMILQFDIPAKTFVAAGKQPGFITRSLVRDDEGEIFQNKMTQSNWHREEWEGRTYYWKDDTSSDEYAGHYYGIPLFYDLCAKTEEEKSELRERIRMSTDYLIAGGYKLIDLDGEKTTHGHWNDLGIAADGPDRCTANGHPLVDCAESYYGGGWLNALEILGHLLATWHMTGDQKYYDAYEDLYTKQRYGKMIRVHEDIFTLSIPSIANHSDHELATLAYYTLLRYEPNEDRREILVKSILDFYEYERPERHPWELGLVAAAVDQDVDLLGAVGTLKEMPTDWRQMLYDNSHRMDAEEEVRDRHDHPQFDRVFPYDEIRTMKWNANPYTISDGGDPRAVLSPTPFQIAYWTMRYHGMIAD